MKQRIWHWIKLITRGIFVVGIFAGIFSYAMFQGGFVSWFLFYTITVLVILMLIYVALPLGSFQIHRDIGDGAAAAGSDVKVTVTIKRKWPFPFLYLAIDDEIEASLKQQLLTGHSKIIFYPSFKRELQYSYNIPAIKRGEYLLYGLYLETSDMFGVFHKKKFVRMEDTLLVYPNYHEIEKWSPYEKRESETRLSTFDFIQDMTSVSGAREYVPGDKLTSIDWKMTARSSKLMTKEFEEFLGQNFLIILNNQLPNRKYATLESYEKAVELVTSIVMHAHKKELKLGLWTLGEETTAFPIDTGADHQKRLIHHLAKVQGVENGDFSSRLRELEENILFGTTILIASTEITDGMLERIRRYTSRRMKVFFCLVDINASSKQMEDSRVEELRRFGAVVYLLSGGNLDQAIPTYVGD